MTDTRRALLDALADGPVAGPAFADEQGVSRAAVWKQVESLRAEGFDVESTDAGYVVREVPEFGEAAVLFGLEADFDVEFHESVPSTNDRARELAGDGDLRDVAVIAGEQTAGRGRLDREWSGPAGGVYCSLLLRPDRPPAHGPVYTLAAAVAVARAAREAGVEAVIKWPNDVLVSRAGPEVPLKAGEAGDETNEGQSDRQSDDILVSRAGPEVPLKAGEVGDETNEGQSDHRSHGVDAEEETRGGRKLCGVLTEMAGEADRIGWLVVGIGVNANVDAEALPVDATSLQRERGEPVERRLFVQRLLEAFDDLRADPDAVLESWREHAVTLGQRVRVETPGGDVVGEAVDVTFPGALVVETDDGERRRVTAGDCEHLRPV